jgi:VCBS repeat-containing protein
MQQQPGQPGYIAAKSETGSNSYGKFSIDTAGVWTYVMDNATMNLRQAPTTPTASPSPLRMAPPSL